MSVFLGVLQMIFFFFNPIEPMKCILASGFIHIKIEILKTGFEFICHITIHKFWQQLTAVCATFLYNHQKYAITFLNEYISIVYVKLTCDISRLPRQWPLCGNDLFKILPHSGSFCSCCSDSCVLRKKMISG